MLTVQQAALARNKSESNNSVEPLETRIAPANVFLSGTSLDVTYVDKTGGVQDVNFIADLPTALNDPANPQFHMATILTAGDVLIFDANGNSKVDKGEFSLLNVKAGKAVVLGSDLNSDGKFEANELTGLLVSDKFNGAVHTDLNGDVVTALTNGNTTDFDFDSLLKFEATDSTHSSGFLTVQSASIAGLTIDGAMTGRLVAGKNILNVKIGSGLYQTGTAPFAVVTGTSAEDVGDGVFGNFDLGLAYNQQDGEAGGNITNVTLANGAFFIQASDGAQSASTGNGGAGGNITNLKVAHAMGSMTVEAGDGGDALFKTGNGGAGGSITGGTITVVGINSDVVFVTAGDGGNVTGEKVPTGVLSGNGGLGGSITNTIVRASGSLRVLGVEAGDGGSIEVPPKLDSNGDPVFDSNGDPVPATNATPGAGQAGGGGSISGSTISFNGGSAASGVTITDVSVEAGDGGETDGSGNGGLGGSLMKNKISVTKAVADDNEIFFVASAGEGGDSEMGKGGDGGSIIGNTISVRGLVDSFEVKGQNGGDGGKRGGNGGKLSNSTVEIFGAFKNQSTDPTEPAFYNTAIVETQGGGDGGEWDEDTGMAISPGIGGAGGNINNLVVTVHSSTGGDLEISSGGGGDSVNSSAATAIGGAINMLTLNTYGSLSSVSIEGSDGGSVVAGDGVAGKGGDLSKVTVNNNADISDFFGFNISGGFGGSSSGKGTGGAGGNLNAIVVNNRGDLFSGLTINSGFGGDVFTGNGGAGGAVTGVTVNNDGSSTLPNNSGVYIFSGAGGSAGEQFEDSDGDGVYTPPEPFTDANGNGSYDFEDYTDDDGDGVYTPPETFTDDNGNGQYDDGEDFEDDNGNGTYDFGDSFNDFNGNGTYDEPEDFTDTNGNGTYDIGDFFNDLNNNGTLDTTGSGNGGNSGNISKTGIHDSGHENFYAISAGSGSNSLMKGAGSQSKGGSMGSITGVTLDGPDAQFLVGSFGEAAGSGQATGGAGGDISKISGSVGTLTIHAASGGDALSAQGTGGKGGSVSDVHVADSGAGIQEIVAGDGGKKGTGANIAISGVGGSITKISTDGDIGNFESPFGFGGFGMGGLAAGRGSTNGSISNVTALRIAAIIAGVPDSDEITFANNAVASLSKIQTLVIGGDINHDGKFSFNDANSNNVFDAGDAAVDGVIVAKQSDINALSASILPGSAITA